MANLNYNVNVNVNQAQQSLDRLTQQVSKVNATFGGLKQAIAGIAFGAFISNAIRTADVLADLSDATGIAISSIQGFRAATQEFGVSAEGAEKGILRLVNGIGEAADGNAGLQEAFSKVGVSLRDLATLSEQQIFEKVLAGLSNFTNASERSAVVTQLLGKEFRNVSGDTEGLRARYEELRNKAQENEASVIAAATAYDKLNTAAGALGNAILIAITPVTDFIATLDNTAIQTFVDDIVKLIKIFAMFAIVSKVTTLIYGLATAFSAASIASVGVTVAMGKFIAIGAALLALLFAINAGLKLVFDVNLLKPVGDAFDAVKKKLQEIFGIEPSKDAREELLKNADAAAKAAKENQNTGRVIREVKDPFEQLKKSISGVSEEYARLNQANINQIKLQTDLIGKGREEQEVLRARGELIRKEADEIAKLEDRRSKLTSEQARAGLGKLIDAEIEKIRQQTKVDMDSTEQAIRNSQARVRAFDLEKFERQSLIDVEKKIRDIQFEIGTMTMTEMEKKSAQITRDAFERAEAEIKAQEASRGSLLTEIEKQKYYDAAKKKSEEVLKSQERLYNKSRDFSTGWKRAFNEYVQNATNAARVAEQLFGKFTQGIEDLFVDFVKTGKFEWRGFVNDMLETLLRSQIKQTLAGLFQGMGGAGGGLLGDLGNMLGSAFGGNAVGSTPNNPMYVIDLSGGGGAVAGAVGGIGGAGSSSGGGIMGAIGNVATSAWDAISGIGSSIGDAIGGIFSSGPEQLSGPSDGGGFLSSIGDFFGGFFANGGMIPANKFGIVGERGPEFIGGPANITPMGMGSVTYNINATDAASFKALVAADPGFIHSVAMMGGQAIPGRR
jgi:lambda family phage tail tape measure protein